MLSTCEHKRKSSISTSRVNKVHACKVDMREVGNTHVEKCERSSS